MNLIKVYKNIKLYFYYIVQMGSLYYVTHSSDAEISNEVSDSDFRKHPDDERNLEQGFTNQVLNRDYFLHFC